MPERKRCPGDTNGLNKGSDCDYRSGECIYCDRKCPYCVGGFVDNGEGGTAICAVCGHKPELRRVSITQPAVRSDKKLIIDHSTHSITEFGDDAIGGEVQPIVNMKPIDEEGRVVESHIFVLRNASSLNLSWHKAYVWPGGNTYVPSDGTDIVTTVMDRRGRMLCTYAKDFR